MFSLILFQRLKNYFSHTVWTTSILLITTIVGILANTLIIKRHEILQGFITKDPNLISLRDRTNHSLKFRFERPIKMETAIEGEGDLFMPHFSNATMTDNSFNHPLSNGGFMMPKNFFLFRSIVGSELFLSKKFFFFPKVFVSQDKRDMTLFLKQPGLLAEFYKKGIGLSNETKTITNLGKIDLQELNGFYETPENYGLNIEVQKYNANSMHFRVSNEVAGLLIYTDLWDKNWYVEVDGNPIPIRKAFFTFKGVELKPGTHNVLFIFKNKIEALLITTNLFFAMLLVALFIMTVFSSKYKIGSDTKIY